MELQNIVPWGRSLAEYQEMFSLSEMDLQRGRRVHPPFGSVLKFQHVIIVGVADEQPGKPPRKSGLTIASRHQGGR